MPSFYVAFRFRNATRPYSNPSELYAQDALLSQQKAYVPQNSEDQCGNQLRPKEYIPPIHSPAAHLYVFYLGKNNIQNENRPCDKKKRIIVPRRDKIKACYRQNHSRHSAPRALDTRKLVKHTRNSYSRNRSEDQIRKTYAYNDRILYYCTPKTLSRFKITFPSTALLSAS